MSEAGRPIGGADLPPARAEVAVVGGGMAGLAAAYQASSSGVRVTLLEEGERLGGKVLTERLDGFLVEAGPDGFVAAKQTVLETAREVGIGDRVIPTRPEPVGTRVWWEGRLHPLPEGLLLMVPGRIGPVLRSPLLSRWGKLRLLAEPLIPARRADRDESLESFVTRRMGREVLERIAEPLVAGVHAARPATMSLRASLPRLLEMERRHGSLLRAAWRRRAEPPSGDLTHLASFRGGMSELVDGLARRLERVEVRLGSPVERIEAGPSGYRLHVLGHPPLEVAAVVLAVPAPAAARLLERIAPRPAAEVAEIETVDMGAVTLAYRRDDLSVPLEGYGFVIPSAAGRRIEGVSYPSRKWEGRVPDERLELVRVFVAGSEVRRGAAAVEGAALAELRALLGISADPVLVRTHLWPSGLHRYTLGHLERIARAEDGLPPGVWLAGGAFHGIGLNECLASGRVAGQAAGRHPVGGG